MYPNPQDVLPLPPRPDLAQYRKRAKDLVKACRSGDDTAIRAWAAQWLADLGALEPDDGHRRRRARNERRIDQVAEFAREKLAPPECALSEAQFVIARAHGFGGWPRLVRHLEELARASTPVSTFEQAVDAIVAGELPALERLLREHPDLVRARATREHRATLLHYVSANGVEDFRQKTPRNIVEIARLLLDAGADVNAEADVYGGGATTLGLVVTSAHPRLAGVQNDLADLLLERGARLDAGSIRSCLMNGCPEAAEHLVRHGASVDLEEAAGIGRLDIVRRKVEERRSADGSAGQRAADHVMIAALMMAAWYDRGQIVEYLLDQGLDVGIRSPKKGDGNTALHIAAYQGHVALVELLLRRGAPVNVTDDEYGTTPLVWALHALVAEQRSPAEPYRAVIGKLIDAGARVEPAVLEDEQIRADEELLAMLRRA